MANSVLVAKEATHGTVGTTFHSVPCLFSCNQDQSNKVAEEVRNSQDIHFGPPMKGVRFSKFAVKTSYVYPDTFGYWLCAAMGVPTKVVVGGETVVWDNTFKFANDPNSLSFQYDDPRRSTDPSQTVYGVVDKMVISFSADGELSYTVDGIAMAPTTIASPVYAFSTVKPFEAWRGLITYNGAANYPNLVSMQITIARNRKPFFTLRNSQDPKNMSIGSRTVEFDGVIDFAARSELLDFQNAAATAGMTAVFTDADTTIGSASHPALTVKLGTMEYESAEKDWDTDTPELKVKGKAIYTAADASLSVVTLRAAVDYTV